MSIQREIRDRRDAAISVVVASLRTDPDFETISEDLLSIRYPSYHAGWALTEPVKKLARGIDIVLPELFPDEPPDVFISGDIGNFHLANPHIEESGKICIFPNSAAIDSCSPARLFRDTIARALEVVNDSDAEDFSDEFSVYWSRAATKPIQRMLLVDPVSDLTVNAFAGETNGTILIGNSQDSVRRWNRMSSRTDSSLSCIESCIVSKIGSALTPDLFPNNASEVQDILSERAPSDSNTFKDILLNKHGKVLVVLLQESGEGALPAGVLLKSPCLARNKRAKRRVQGIDIVTSRARFLQKIPAHRLVTKDVGHGWIHSRGGEGGDLNNKRVVVVGCGSLGGYVAHLLARAGVGNLTLLDNDYLEWDNVGRHILGAESVGSWKASTLGGRLQRELPHLTIESVCKDWRSWVQDDDNAFVGSDLVISTVADWRCERPLNALLKRSSLPLMFAWLEPYAIAGHVLTCVGDGGCLECGMNRFGQFRTAVARFADKTLLKVPGGCTYYQQYGPVGLMPIAAMTAEAAISFLRNPPTMSGLRTMIGSLETIVEQGGVLNSEWTDEVNAELAHQTIVKDWTRNLDCKVCAQPD